MSRKQVQVSIGVLVDLSQPSPRVLIARRRHDTVLAGFWEFPGGKIEPDESPRDCVIREFEEELGIRVVVDEAMPVIDHEYDYANVRLYPFYCRPDGADKRSPQNLAVAEHRWVAPHELAAYEFPPANKGLVERVIQTLTRDARVRGAANP